MNMKSVFSFLRKRFFPVVLWCMLPVLSSCGYQVGNMMHPQIKTLAIADVKNETMEVQASALLRGILAERFQFDNSLKLTTPDKADCVIYAKIVSVSSVNVAWSSEDADENFRPTLFRLTANVKYTVRVPGQAKELIPSGSASGSAVYQYTNDPSVGKRDGLRQAFFQISNKIVNAVTEGW